MAVICWHESAVKVATTTLNATADAAASWFHEFGVKYLFSGHYHRNAIARDGDLEAVTTGPVGKPLGEGKSGLRVVIVRDDHIEHRFYDFGELPNRMDLAATKPKSAPATPP